MFDVYCPRHAHRVLLGFRSIRSIENAPDGPLLHWRCRCGASGPLFPKREVAR